MIISINLLFTYCNHFNDSLQRLVQQFNLLCGCTLQSNFNRQHLPQPFSTTQAAMLRYLLVYGFLLRNELSKRSRYTKTYPKYYESKSTTIVDLTVMGRNSYKIIFCGGNLLLFFRSVFFPFSDKACQTPFCKYLAWD